MSRELRFYLPEEDLDRLFAIKEDMGELDLTGDEFARDLLTKEIRRLHPEIVRFDEETGERIKKMTEIITERYILHEGSCFYEGDTVMIGGAERPIVEAVIDRVGEARIWFLSSDGFFALCADEIAYLKKKEK